MNEQCYKSDAWLFCVCASVQLLFCVVVFSLSVCVALYRARRWCGAFSTLSDLQAGRQGGGGYATHEGV